MSGDEEATLITGKDLLQATAPFAEEDRPRSWRLFGSTLAILSAALVTAAVAPWWPMRLTASIIGGLTIVRAFIFYHDFLHGALLSDSRLAKGLLYIIGLLMLTPPKHWRYSHNYHHAHVGKVIVSKPGVYPVLTADIGSFPLMTTEQWQGASTWHRLRYRVTRHPLTILGAYVTIFLFVNCLVPLLKEPRKYWDGALSLLTHGGLIALLWVFGGLDVALFAFVLPFAIAAGLGAYLFYAQHTFEGLRIVPPEDWTFYQGALESSTYMRLGPIMRWFTGDIGYHHVHHVNSHIPFYRLAEAMAAIPALQNPVVTSLRPTDVRSCFRANLWDPHLQRMVSYGQARRRDD